VCLCCTVLQLDSQGSEMLAACHLVRSLIICKETTAAHFPTDSPQPVLYISSCPSAYVPVTALILAVKQNPQVLVLNPFLTCR
jgi:hypothetical protein